MYALQSKENIFFWSYANDLFDIGIYYKVSLNYGKSRSQLKLNQYK